MSLYVGLPTNPNQTKSESHSDSYNIGKEDNKMFWIKKTSPTDPNYTKSKSQSDICSKKCRNISNEIDIQEFLSDNLKDLIDNCDIGKVGNEMTWTKKNATSRPQSHQKQKS